MRDFEMCCRCGEPTGRAGRADDSLYTDDDRGPYCWDCWGDAEYWREEYIAAILRPGGER